MRSPILRTSLTLLALLTMMTIMAAADPTGRIIGSVVDDHSGLAIAAATLQINGTTIGAKSDIDGRFSITAVPVGVQTMVVSAPRYQALNIINLNIGSGATLEMVIRLQPRAEGQNGARTLDPAKGDAEERRLVAAFQTVKIEADEYMPGSELTKKERPHGQYIPFQTGTVRPCIMPIPPQPPGYPPAHGGTSIVNDEPFDAMFFKNYGVNPFVDTEDDNLSTFAADVDDASYIMTRSYLERGELPPNEAVRVEEFINHFDYGYAAPYEAPFAVYIEGAESRFGSNCSLLRIGIQGMQIPSEMRKPANLTFVIDVSGSMGRENRLELVKRALLVLLDELRDDDRVGIVIYGSRGLEILPPTSIRYRYDIERAIHGLCTGGATNAEEGLILGYRMAERAFEKGKINRVILCSDGVANVGRSGPDALLEEIKRHADRGITLSAIGFGMGNYNDVLLEKLGNKGNGYYAYVDDLAEARRIFVDNLTGNLQVIARDVKIQVEFDPDMVRSYRLLGYENRDVADDKFRDDREDGGEVGAGHTVTALYEIKLHPRQPKKEVIGTVYIRYKDPDSFAVTEFSQPFGRRPFGRAFGSASPQFRLAAAAAEFAEILRGSYWARGSDLGDVLAVLRGLEGEMPQHEIDELIYLISRAEQLDERLADDR